MALPVSAKRREVIQALRHVFDAFPKGQFRKIILDAQHVEHVLRGGLRAFDLLDGIRDYILSMGDKLGGERSPFVLAIDELLERPEPQPVDLGEHPPDGPPAGGEKGGAA